MPNVEPIMAVQVPFAKTYGRLFGFLFGVSSIVFYDALTGTVGIWTIVTAASYGFVGVYAAYFFTNRSMNKRNIILFVAASTLFYDAVTGLLIGPLFFHQSFVIAFVGQIPFTITHLFGNLIFSLVLSPSIASFLAHKERRAYSPSLLESLSTIQL